MDLITTESMAVTYEMLSPKMIEEIKEQARIDGLCEAWELLRVEYKESYVPTRIIAKEIDTRIKATKSRALLFNH